MPNASLASPTPPDLAAASAFVAAIAGGEDVPVTFQTFDDSEEKRPYLARVLHGTLVEHADELARLNAEGAGIFLTINRTDLKGRKKGNVVALNALFTDNDGPSKPLALAPSIVVQSAGGKHDYWLLDAEDGDELDAFPDAQKQLAAFYGSDPKVHDLPRVMRLPGFDWRKEEPAFRVQLLEVHRERRYRLTEILAAHPVAKPTPPPAPPRPQLVAGAGGDRIRRASAYLATIPGAVSGSGGHDQTFKAALALVRGFNLSRSEALSLLVADYNPRCEPPWSDRELEHKVESAEKDSTLPPGYLLDARPGGGADADALRRMTTERPRKTPPAPVPDAPSDALAPTSIDPPPASSASDEDLVIEITAALEARRPAEEVAPLIARLRSSMLQDQQISRLSHERGVSRVAVRKEVAEHKRKARWKGAADQPRAVIDDAYGLDLPSGRWHISAEGVYPLRFDGSIDTKGVVATRPIWPSAIGRDRATGREHVRLAWVDPRGKTRFEWVPETTLRSRDDLRALDGAPVSLGRLTSLSDWLVDALAGVRVRDLAITTSVGWIGGAWTWPMPESADAEPPSDSHPLFVGSALPEPGDPAAYLAGVQHLLTLGPSGFTALACLGAAAGAPLSRLLGRRNPIVGLVSESSQGKGSAINFALALWTDPRDLTLPASSTAKGAQDRAIAMPDLPLFADELHQLLERDPLQAADALYFLGNGQRRVTSTRTQQSRGGERRYGVGFFAAERPVVPSLPLGAQYRTIELEGAPCPDLTTSAVLQRASRAHGALAVALGRELATSRDRLVGVLELRSQRIREQAAGLAGDDAESLAIVMTGLELLARAAGLELPAQRVVEWLAGRVIEQRKNTVDRETAGFLAMLDVVMNGDWGQINVSGYSELGFGGERIAWRRGVQDRPTLLDINPRAQRVAVVLSKFGGDSSLRSAWARRGWLETAGDGCFAVKRDGFGRVLRISSKGFDLYWDSHNDE